MHHSEYDNLTERENWIVHELLNYSSENTTHLTENCFEQSYYFGEKATLFGTKFFYDSMFGNSKEAKWTGERIAELPDGYRTICLQITGLNLNRLYSYIIKRDPSLQKIIHNSCQRLIESISNEKEDLK